MPSAARRSAADALTDAKAPAITAPSSLVWSSDAAPGLRRRRAGRGFVYADEQGARIQDPDVIARIKSIAIPPAWTDVWINPDPLGHLQATGRDAKGRKQYRYHLQFREVREQTKFEKLANFGRALPHIRAQVEADLARPQLDRAKVLATIVRLLEATLVRVGNEEYAKTNGSYGLTTLRNRHVKVGDDGVELRFKGKSGVSHQVSIGSRRMARIVRRCQELPGQTLFEYRENGAVSPVTSNDVNDYLRTTSGIDITAKDFRTWMATLLASVALGAVHPPDSARERVQLLNHAMRGIAAELGNTPAVARRSYVHPVIVDAFLDGSLPERIARVRPVRLRGLQPEERVLLAVLEDAARTRRRRRRLPATLTGYGGGEPTNTSRRTNG